MFVLIRKQIVFENQCLPRPKGSTDYQEVFAIGSGQKLIENPKQISLFN